MVSFAIDDRDKQKSMMVFIIQPAEMTDLLDYKPIALSPRSAGGKIMPEVEFPANCSIVFAFSRKTDEELKKIVEEGTTRALLNHLMKELVSA